MQKQEKKFITFSEAVKDLNLILCNDITKYHELTDYTFRIEDFIDDELVKEVYEDDFYETDEEREEAIREKATEIGYNKEVCQYYLTSISQDYAEYLTKKYGLKFAYCDDLNLYVLLVTFYGVSWDDTYVEVK